MAAQAEHLRNRVLTLESEQPSQIREQVLWVLREFFPADYGLYVRVAQSEDVDAPPERRQGLSFTGGVHCGDDEVRQALMPYFDGPVVETPWLPPMLRREDINQVVRTHNRYDPDYIDGLQLQQEVFGPLAIGDQMRVILWDGPRLLGWLGLMRRGQRERFLDAEAQIFAHAVEAVRSAILASVHLEQEAFQDSLAAVFNADGRPEVASPAFRTWVSPSRRDALSRWVRRFDAGNSTGSRRFFGDVQAHLVRLDGPDSVRYLISVESVQLFELSPEYWLTPRQREVARLAVLGATSPEIAEELDLSPQTVKTHMRDIFRRLEIGTRAELATRVAS